MPLLRKAPLRFLAVLATASFLSVQALGQVVINEVCSKNNGILLDAEGSSPDWLELYNNGASDVDLEDFYLSDDSTNLQKWELPDVELQPGEHLLLFCSGKDIQLSLYHTNFKISQDGETLILSDDNGTVIDQVNTDFIGADHSYGRYPSGGNTFFYFGIPTATAQNSTSLGYNGYAASPVFSNPAGFYEGTFALEAESPTNGATVRYSADGSVPTAQSTLFPASIPINNRQVIRAQAFADSMLPSPINTASYFINERNNLTVVSLSCDDSLLFDSVTGIHMLGPNAEPATPASRRKLLVGHRSACTRRIVQQFRRTWARLRP